MKTTVCALCFLVFLFAVPFLFSQHGVGAARAAPALAGLELTGPYAYQNLAVFVVQDHNTAKHAEIVTLEEGLAKGVVRIEEVGQVNRLVASNKGDKGVYLQSGDIVKGGQQDRVIQHDTLLPPHSQKVALSVFCVEAGRWQGRPGEPVRHFASSNSTLVTKKQKMAVKVAADQSSVWDSVAAAQTEFGSKLGKSVQAPASATSLQLTLEDKTLTDTVEDYVRNIEKQIPRQPDAVGYAVAVDGTVDAVDVFASPSLFGKMKNKLLRASAAQAIAAKGKEATPLPKIDAVEALISDAESGAVRTEKQTLRTQITRKETARNVVFTTDDPLVPGKAMHKSYLAK